MKNFFKGNSAREGYTISQLFTTEGQHRTIQG